MACDAEPVCHYQILGGDTTNANDNGQTKPRERLSNPILERLAVMGELERWLLQPSTISLKSELGRGSFGVTNKAVIASTVRWRLVLSCKRKDECQGRSLTRLMSFLPVLVLGWGCVPRAGCRRQAHRHQAERYGKHPQRVPRDCHLGAPATPLHPGIHGRRSHRKDAQRRRG